MTRKIVLELRDAEARPGLYDFLDAPWAITSFYDIETVDTLEDTIEALQNRMYQILDLNPWLMSYGKQVKDPAKWTQRLKYIEYDPDDDKTKFVKVVVDDELFCQTDYISLNKSMQKYLPRKFPTLPYKSPVSTFQFTIAQNETKNKICLIVAWSHMIADGGTMHTIYKMLDPKETPFAMTLLGKSVDVDAKIKTETSLFDTETDSETSEREHGFSESYWFWIVKNTLKRWWTGSKQTAAVYKFNTSEINKVKTVYKTDTSYVSTNDIVGHWVKQIVGSSCTSLMIPVNLRDKLTGVGPNCAGNYVGMATLHDDDLDTPLKMRKKLQLLVKPGYEWTAKHTDSMEFLMHDNWSAFYHHLEPEGWRQTSHIPIFEVEGTFFLTHKVNRTETAVVATIDLEHVSQESLLATALVDSKIM